MTTADLYKLASYANVTFGVPVMPMQPTRMANRIRMIGACPGCTRHEDGKWWKPCPFTDCVEHGPAGVPVQVRS